jgi:hypothetical protein
MEAIPQPTSKWCTQLILWNYLLKVYERNTLINLKLPLGEKNRNTYKLDEGVLMIRAICLDSHKHASIKIGSLVQHILSMHLMRTLQKLLLPSSAEPSPGSGSLHWPYQAFYRRHHDVRKSHHPAHIQKHMFAVETLLRHDAEAHGQNMMNLQIFIWTSICINLYSFRSTRRHESKQGLGFSTGIVDQKVKFWSTILTYVKINL